jgi:hypothetical protein
MVLTAPDIIGREKLVSVFGYWPSFHDAEVIGLQLDRSGSELGHGPTLTLAIHVFEITREVTSSGCLALRHHVLVRFRFSGVVEMAFENFNHQNVLWELSIKDIRDRQMEWIGFEVRLSTSHGLEGEYKCFRAEVASVEPWEGGG